MSDNFNQRLNEKLNLALPIQIIRARRKSTVGICIEAKTLLITVPHTLSEAKIEMNLVEYKARLIRMVDQYQSQPNEDEQICLFDEKTKLIKSIYGFPVIVERKDRTRIGIVIDAEKVLVKVSNDTSDTKINEYIKEKYRWIKRNLQKRIEFIPPKSKEFKSGSKLLYLGNEFTLNIKASKLNTVKITNEEIIISMPVDIGKSAQKTLLGNLLLNWYHVEATKVLKAKVEKYESLIGVKHTSFKLGDFKSKWGHCTNLNDLAFNWRLILAPEDVLDYVVVHELCHILEHNHSSKFWKLVASYLPNYQKQEQWLNENSNKVFITNNVF